MRIFGVEIIIDHIFNIIVFYESLQMQVSFRDILLSIPLDFYTSMQINLLHSQKNIPFCLNKGLRERIWPTFGLDRIILYTSRFAVQIWPLKWLNKVARVLSVVNHTTHTSSLSADDVRPIRD